MERVAIYESHERAADGESAEVGSICVKITPELCGRKRM